MASHKLSSTLLYRYQPLPDGYIRVLHISSGRRPPQGPLQGHLECRPVRCEGEFRPFMTLSYAWGTTFDNGSHLTKTIKVDGAWIRITASLFQILEHIRSLMYRGELARDIFADPRNPTLPPIWIDAICINQDDMIERNQQVRLMADIYSSSSRLLIWLGSRFEAGPLDCKTLEQSPWCQRRWVIQEYALTPYYSRFFLQRDRLVGTWSVLLSGQPDYFYDRTYEDRAEGNSSTAYLNRLRRVRNIGPLGYDPFRERTSNSLLFNLYHFEQSQCSKPHDLVYSLLSLAQTSAETDGIVVDYTKSTEDVFMEVAISIIKARTTFERLAAVLATATAKPSDNDELPSWVPDWRRSSKFRHDNHHLAVDILLFWISDLDVGELGDFGSKTKKLRSNRKSQQPNGDAMVVQPSLRAIEGRFLRLAGRLLMLCEAIRLTNDFVIEKSPHPVGVECWRCNFSSEAPHIFRPETELTADETDAANDVADEFYFIMPSSPVVFILRPLPFDEEYSDEPTPRFRLASCVFVGYGTEGISPSTWRSMFVNQDEILLG